jgi:hypothetical protein
MFYGRVPHHAGFAPTLQAKGVSHSKGHSTFRAPDRRTHLDPSSAARVVRFKFSKNGAAISEITRIPIQPVADGAGSHYITSVPPRPTKEASPSRANPQRFRKGFRTRKSAPAGTRVSCSPVPIRTSRPPSAMYFAIFRRIPWPCGKTIAWRIIYTTREIRRKINC